MTKLLIVDDNERNLYLLEVLLKGHGYEVVAAGDGAEALEKARRDPPDVIISDILMPVMDGFTLCRQWKKDDRLKAIPFVFYTATYTDPKDEEFALNLGAERFIVKPVEPHVFVETLWEVIREAEEGRLVAPRKRVEEEPVYLKEYSERLVRKLEKKMLDLEREIAERKQAEEGQRKALAEALQATHALRVSEERFRELVENANDIIYTHDLEGNFTSANPAATRAYGYTTEEILQLNIAQIVDSEYLPLAQQKIREKLEGAPRTEAYELLTHSQEGKPIWVEVNTRLMEREGRPVEVQGIARDVTERKRAEEELRQSYEKLRVALGGTIAVLTSVVEIRDPYTAGHQQRVAKLACAIANDMGLAEEHIEGIRMAGLIHDLGKIDVPAEILSNPGKLNDLQWGMIKMHPQVGYDILKTVEFPWPVAETVLQHHERLDGSGYPQGLAGKDILMKARILAVADVVEAMASFRPYRPARGIDKALEEISQNRGILYDADAVDTCLKLFTENGFEFE